MVQQAIDRLTLEDDLLFRNEIFEGIFFHLLHVLRLQPFSILTFVIDCKDKLLQRNLFQEDSMMWLKSE